MSPYELRIGVTGHRVIENPAAVARALRGLIQHIVTTFSRSPVTWTVVSPLARGADRLVADAVL